MYRSSIQAVFFKALYERSIDDRFAGGTSRFPIHPDRVSFADAIASLLDAGNGNDDVVLSTPKTRSNPFRITERLLDVPKADRCDSDPCEPEDEDNEQGLMKLFRSGGEGHLRMNKELLEKLDLGDRFELEDLLLLSTLFNQQDPNAPQTNSLLNAIVVGKILARSGLGRVIETALVLSQLLNQGSR